MRKKWILIAGLTVLFSIAIVACGKKAENEQGEQQQGQVEVPTANQLDAKVVEVQEEYLMVEAAEGQSVAGEVKIWIGLLDKDEVPQLKKGDVIRITHDGKMTMSIPPQMSAVEPIEIIK